MSLSLAPSRRRPAPWLQGLAPAVALAYPALLWSQVHFSSVFVLAALAAPWPALWLAHRLNSTLAPSSRVIALAAVTAPALFNFLGGWLDRLPYPLLNGVPVWIALWSVATLVALLERPPVGVAGEVPRNPGRRLAIAHGVSATIILTFAALHLVNHLAGAWSGDLHASIMEGLRAVYRHRLVEPALATVIGFQLISGAILLGRKLPRAQAWPDVLQLASGLYLVVFFLSHASALFRARLRQVDTNWAWLTEDNLLADPWSVRLVPYYFFGVVALSIHVGAGLRGILRHHGWASQTADRVFASIIFAGLSLAAAIMFGLVRSSLA